MKRKHIHLTRDDKYGHWWFEIGDPMDADSESYGWWPKCPVGMVDTLVGVDGELNGRTNFRGTVARDPHHGDNADEEFHPLVASSDLRTDGEIAECLRLFAGSYAGEWRWMFGCGQNCHSFQEAAMTHCDLRKSIPKSYL